MITIFPCGSWRSKGVASGSGVFLWLLVAELGTPKCAKIFTYGKWLHPYRIILHGASDLEQRCLKTRNSENDCTFSPNIFAPTPKIIPKPHIGGPFNAKPIIEKAIRNLVKEHAFCCCTHTNGYLLVRLKYIYWVTKLNILLIHCSVQPSMVQPL